MVQIINWLHQDHHYPSFVHLYENALNFLGSIVKIHKMKKPKLNTIDIIYNSRYLSLWECILGD